QVAAARVLERRERQLRQRTVRQDREATPGGARQLRFDGSDDQAVQRPPRGRRLCADDEHVASARPERLRIDVAGPRSGARLADVTVTRAAWIGPSAGTTQT